MLHKIKDLDTLKRPGTADSVEWQSKSGVRYRYERSSRRVGVEIGLLPLRHEWIATNVPDLTAAKRIVFDAINNDEF